MYRFGAALFALWVTQQEPAPAPPPESPPESEPQAKPPAAVAAPAPAEPAPPPPAPLPVAPAASPGVAPSAPPPRRGAAAPTPPASTSPPAPSPRPAPLPSPPAPAPQAPAAPVPPPPAQPSPASPLPERERALRTALAFVQGLVNSDSGGLAALSTATFSFDGDAVQGRDAQVRRWGEIFAGREAAGAELRDLALLTVPEALGQLGPPPPRIAALLKPGAWVAVADLSGRPVVIVLVQEGGRLAAAGMHD